MLSHASSFAWSRARLSSVARRSFSTTTAPHDNGNLTKYGSTKSIPLLSHGYNDKTTSQSSSFSTLVAIAHGNYEQSETSFENEKKKWTPQLTKIVATIGPTSEQLDVLQDVVKSGMRIMRLNFSHATTEEVELRVSNLKKCKGRHGAVLGSGNDNPETFNNVRATLLDTRGPEIRCGKLRNDHSGHETVTLQAGSSVTLHTDKHWQDAGGNSTDLYIDYINLHKSLDVGMKVLLDDGAIIMTVTSVEKDKEFHGTVTCTIDNTGELRSRAGVNLPGAATDLPAMSEKDRIDIKYGMTKDVDYLAASFIQNADGVREIRRYMRECANELGWEPTAPLPLIISKIESVSACNNFDEILAESDGIMVARGDLGVEIPIQQVVNAQKEMVSACNAVGKPVIVATQMLESMAKNPRPTRAEVADVTNAVYDGADAVMLSGETAKGKYPIEAVKMMNEIIFSAEGFAQSRPDLANTYGGRIFAERHADMDPKLKQEASLAKAAVAAAFKRSASAILVLPSVQTLGGDNLPRLVSANRPDVPIVVFSPSAKVARQLMLHRGVHPVVGQLSGVSFQKRPGRAMKFAQQMGFVSAGDDVVLVGMEPSGTDDEMFATLRVATVS
uniref:Pyruvate kinase n=1 Tax=Eucampia antarctica TaxID=49252 RepID=A0A7S2WB68_9STRA|mmetsp:Transcript_25226/g.24179  ORF Transcript_25226/g.24179 Transcript_25226/m.24179 type:complete len:615 (+) Transcript_25226:104-1948(+)|eukprot:CAMPEP_0197832812 /NCGR_PEP_ID=MMETSP1437-20131217/16277_1 /TAXON_ID=49252 ORGANISM="Eucampia antarctica, Strain CCMP1452" /NCGR_SAMPLE_ID=MMETSP1437 /ASSEMBLY_ACC=CAM_ASM_001096 /LENGTH=614 /DNA_ID=CAMNT_0043436409 /DNA_START=81 /DNA_END=1925 /DNA_ORIENTATION=+